MAIRQLHPLPDFDAEECDRLCQFHLPEEHAERWNVALQLEEGEGDRIVKVQGVIGFPEWADGTTAKMVDQRLQELGDGDVTVTINSPGGIFFEGQAIYNRLRAHKGKVTVQVMGMAASAASVIAMAGDEIQIAPAGWFMVHKVHGMTIGNHAPHEAAARLMRRMDEATADLYAERTGRTFRQVMDLMHGDDGDGTYLTAKDAVKERFADSIMDVSRVTGGDRKKQSSESLIRQALVQSLQKSGHSRNESRALVAQLRSGMPRAAVPGKPRAADALPAVSQALETVSALDVPSFADLVKKG
jgi:ATP-dependent Clp protease protease subunit